jgi:hypothetical protein
MKLAGSIPTPTIRITLPTNGNANEVRTLYPKGQTAEQRKRYQLDKIRDAKLGRNSRPNKPPNFSEDFSHDSWIPFPGEIVEWKCETPFTLQIDYDTNVCDPVPGAPRNPFGWDGDQTAERLPLGGYAVYGVALSNDQIFAQMFYKFKAKVEGAAPIDPDGICGSR